MDLPFTEGEKRFVVAEVLKSSDVPLQKLMELITNDAVQPAWSDMLLPGGRTLKNCIDAFEEILASSTHLVNTTKRKSDQLDLPAETSQKRRQHGAEAITPVRSIKPKPAANGSPAVTPTPATSAPKKRGRPSKADLKARSEEAIARGEALPTPKRKGPVKATEKMETGTSEVAIEGVEAEQFGQADKEVTITSKKQGKPTSPKVNVGHHFDSASAENASTAALEVLPPVGMSKQSKEPEGPGDRKSPAKDISFPAPQEGEDESPEHDL